MGKNGFGPLELIAKRARVKVHFSVCPFAFVLKDFILVTDVSREAFPPHIYRYTNAHPLLLVRIGGTGDVVIEPKEKNKTTGCR